MRLSAKQRETLKFLGHSAIYVIGADTGPVKIGYASDIFQRLADIQISHWQTLKVHYAAWTSGRLTAGDVEKEAHAILDKAKLRVRGEWFDVSHQLACDTIHVAARNAGRKLWTYKDMMERIGRSEAQQEKINGEAFIFFMKGLDRIKNVR